MFDLRWLSGAKRAGGSRAAPVCRKWYFAVNDRGFRRERDLISVAVRSCRANTPLQPHCIYNGADPDVAAWMTAQGVTLVHHRSALEAELQAAYGAKYDTFSGHWLRCDLPLIERDDDFVLYTDIDVLFLNWTEPPPFPERAFAAAPQDDPDERVAFNSGVLAINLPVMREALPAFHAAIRHRLAGAFRYPAHDQQSFNHVFRDARDALPLRFNWKPYWGVSEDAAIVHFHGPKPKHMASIDVGETPARLKFKALHRRNPEGYAFYCARFAEMMG